MSPRFYVCITMTRPQNMERICEFYLRGLDDHPFEIRLLIGVQGNEPDPKGVNKCNEMIDLVPDGCWFSCIADDTLEHPTLLKRVAKLIDEHQEAGAFVFGGKRNAGTIFHAVPENMHDGCVCGSQIVLNKSFIGSHRFEYSKYGDRCDGKLINTIFTQYPDKVVLVDEPLRYFGSLEW